MTSHSTNQCVPHHSITNLHLAFSNQEITMHTDNTKDPWETMTVGLVTTLLVVVLGLLVAEMSRQHLWLPSVVVVLGALSAVRYFAVKEPEQAAKSAPNR